MLAAVQAALRTAARGCATVASSVGLDDRCAQWWFVGEGSRNGLLEPEQLEKQREAMARCGQWVATVAQGKLKSTNR